MEGADQTDSVQIGSAKKIIVYTPHEPPEQAVQWHTE